MPRAGRDFYKAYVLIEQEQVRLLPEVSPDDLVAAFSAVLSKAKLRVGKS